MDSSASTTTLNIFGTEISGLLVSAFSPTHFLWLIVIISISIIIYKYGDKWFSPKKKTNCKTCFELINIHSEIRNKKVNEIENSILQEQLSYGCLVLSTIKSKIIDIYRKQADKIVLDPQRLKDELDCYSAFIQVQYDVAYSWLETRLKQNHLSEKTDEEFSVYCKEVISKIIMDSRMSMVSHWSKFFTVAVSDNKKFIEDIHVEMYNDILSIFTNAKKIAKEKREQIEKINKDYDDEMSKLLEKARTGKL